MLDLEHADPERRRRAQAGLESAGAPGARAVLSGFERAPPAARELRARVLEAEPRGELLPELLALAGDPAPAVRAPCRLPRAVASPTLSLPGEFEACVAKLSSLAGEDPNGPVRASALDALARSDSESAASVLTRLARGAVGAEGVLAARALAGSPRGGASVLTLVQGALGDPAQRLDEPVLATLLAEGYGPALAERSEGGLSALDRRPFVLGERDPSAAVRAAAELAFQGFLGRARFLGAVSRAEQVAALLAEELRDPAPVWLASAVLTLGAGDDPAPALRALARWRARGSRRRRPRMPAAAAISPWPRP
ncbi:MAG: hypothetical protein IPK67_17925 [Planctomycetes bacterium]|nr:hypothetical protein [Planctomycetota bacterium]